MKIVHFLFLIFVGIFAASGSGGYQRPGLMPGRDGPLGLHHPDLLGRPYAEQLAHQVTINLFVSLCKLRVNLQKQSSFKNLSYSNARVNNFIF